MFAPEDDFEASELYRGERVGYHWRRYDERSSGPPLRREELAEVAAGYKKHHGYTNAPHGSGYYRDPRYPYIHLEHEEREEREERRRGGHAAGTLYTRLGGVYPISLFCDRVVDALLEYSSDLPLDAKRSSASLKYLFTELVCHKCGGPEVLTGNGLEESRLLCSSKELFQLIRSAEAASDHIRNQSDRAELIQTLYAARELILDPLRTEHDDPNGYVEAIQKLSVESTVPMAYIPGGGAVFFAGRDQHFGDACVDGMNPTCGAPCTGPHC